MLKYTPPKEEVPNVHNYAAETTEIYKNHLYYMKVTIETFITSTQTKISAIINDRETGFQLKCTIMISIMVGFG